jgi:hypothetical protein
LSEFSICSEETEGMHEYRGIGELSSDSDGDVGVIVELEGVARIPFVLQHDGLAARRFMLPAFSVLRIDSVGERMGSPMVSARLVRAPTQGLRDQVDDVVAGSTIGDDSMAFTYFVDGWHCRMEMRVQSRARISEVASSLGGEGVYEI